MTWLPAHLDITVTYYLYDGSMQTEAVDTWDIDDLCPPSNTRSLIMKRWISANGMLFEAPRPTYRAYYVGTILSVGDILAQYEDSAEREEMIEDAQYYGTGLLILCANGNYYGFHKSDKVIAPDYWRNLREASRDEAV